jgi:hypothetical protein
MFRVQHLIVGHRLQAARRTGIVDQAGKSGRNSEPGLKGLRRGRRQGIPVPILSLEMADHAVGIRPDLGQTQGQGGLAQGLNGLDQDIPGKLRVFHGIQIFGQNDVASQTHGLGQGGVVLRGRGVGKEDVEDDEAGAGRVQSLDQGGMEAAGPGPGLPQLLEGWFVDTHDEQWRRGLGRSPGIEQVQPGVFHELPDPGGAQEGQESKDQQPQDQRAISRPQYFRNRGQV